jgi:hypothetical protein
MRYTMEDFKKGTFCVDFAGAVNPRESLKRFLHWCELADLGWELWRDDNDTITPASEFLPIATHPHYDIAYRTGTLYHGAILEDTPRVPFGAIIPPTED